MAKVVFEKLIDFITAATPSIGYLIGYDLDGVLKQKDKFGVITPIGASAVSIPPSNPLDVVLLSGNNSGSSSIIMGTNTNISTSNGSGKLELDKSLDVISLSTDDSEILLNPGSVSISNSIGLTSSNLILGENTSLKNGTNDKYSKFEQNINELNISFTNDTLPGVKKVGTIETGINYVAGVDNITYLHLNTQGSTTNPNIKNSVIIGGNGLVSSSNNTVYVKNLETQGGLSKYSIDPSTLGGFDNLTMITKGYLDLATASIYTYIDTTTASIYTYIDTTTASIYNYIDVATASIYNYIDSITSSGTFSSLTADNGLSISGSDVVLGGTLSQSTTIAGGNQELFLGLTSSQITFLHIDAIQAQERYTAPGAGVLEINKNPGGFNLEIYDPNNQTSNRLDINNNSVLNSINFSTGAGSQQYASPLAAIQMTDDGAGNRSEIVTTIDKSEVGQTVVGTSSTSGLKLNRNTGYKFEYVRTAGAGLEYVDDYSTNYTPLSLITKGDLDLATSSIYNYIDNNSGTSSGTFSNLTADNGLDISNNVIVLGGTLSQNTTIAGGSQDINLGSTSSKLNEFNINGVISTQNYTSPGFNNITTSYAPGTITHNSNNPTNTITNEFFVNPSQTRTQAADTNLNLLTFLDMSNSQLQGQSSNTLTNANSIFSTSANVVQLSHTDGVGLYNGVYLSDNNILLNHTYGVTSSSIVLDETQLTLSGPNNTNLTLGDFDTTFTDNRSTTKGIEYDADYSAGYTPDSLITKRDLDSATSSIYNYVDSTTFSGVNGITIDPSGNVNLGGTVSQSKTILLPDGGGSRIFRLGDADGTGTITPFTRFDSLTNQGLLHIDAVSSTQPASYTFQDDSIYIKKYAQQAGNIDLDSNPGSTFVNLGYQSTDSINLFLRTIYDTPGSTVAKSEFSQSTTGFVFDSITSDPYTTRFSISSGVISSSIVDVSGTSSVLFGSTIMMLLTTDSSGLFANGTEVSLLSAGSYIRIDDAATGDNLVNDDSINLRGLRYTGFGETDVDGANANYSTLVGNSLVPKKYVDNKVASSIDYKGGYDASIVGPNSSATTGNMYTVTVAGNGGGYFTTSLEIGDVIISEVDNPSSETDWTVVSKDLDASSIKVSYESNIDTNAYTDSEQTKIGFVSVTQAVDLDIMESDININNSKVSNVTTDLSIGNKTSTTLDVLSSDGTNATIPSVTNLEAGLSTAADKTKLDGIEPLADVTNTTNVTNSGALMDSEITNLTQVKSFDSSDYATSAQGILATNALPKSGGTMTGDINLLDDVRLNVGNSSDLQIYHDSVAGSSIIEDSGSGNLILLGNGPDGILLGKGPTSSYERMIRALPDSGVEIFFDDVKKLETNNTGVNVTGDVTLTGLVDGRDVSTDGLKLDGIEPLADVTLNSISAGTNITISAGGVISATSGSSSVTELDDLSDVTTNFPVSPTEADDGKILFYDYDLDKWTTDDTITHGTSVINGKKSTAGTITKGTPVYLVGFDNDLHTVEAANSSSISTMPCIGLSAETMDNTNSKHIITFGKLTGVNTNSFTQNDILYVDTTTGGLTTTRPTGSTSQIQRIAKVLKVGINDGQLLVFNTARTAGLPNLTSNKLWIGDVDSIPEEIEIGKGLDVSGGNLISRPTDNTQASVSTLTPDSDINDQETITGLSTDLTINAPTGTPTNGQKLIIRIEDNGTPRTLNWNVIYEVIGVTLPTTTNANKKMYIGCIYNSSDSTWDVVAVNEEA